MLNPRYVERIKGLADRIKAKEDLYIIGKSWNYPMALESAIKIQEVSYIHAEGFAAGVPTGGLSQATTAMVPARPVASRCSHSASCVISRPIRE